MRPALYRALIKIVTILVMAGLSLPYDAAERSSTESVEATDPEVFEDVVESFYEDHPDMTRQHIAQVWGEQSTRKDFSEALGVLELPSVTGTSFDAQANLLHVRVSDDASTTEICALADSFGLVVSVDEVSYTADELKSLAEELRVILDVHGEGQTTIAGVVTDRSINRVKVGVRSAERALSLPAEVTADPRVVVIVVADDPVLTACTNRLGCGTPARSVQS